MKLVRKKVIFIKTEATQNTDVHSSMAATDALLVEDFTVKPVPDLIKRNPKRSNIDTLAHVMGTKYVEVSFKTEAKNGGSPGTVYPPFDAAIQACGFARTTNSGVEAISTARASGTNLGVSPAPVVAIGTPAFSAVSGILHLTLTATVDTNPESATFLGEFVPGDGSPAKFGSVTVTDTAFTAEAFDGDLTSLDLTTNDPDAGGLGDPVSTWHVGDSWDFVYTSASQVDVSYDGVSDPASSNYFGPGKSCTIQGNYDGLNHIIAGCLGTPHLVAVAGKIAYWEFNFKGQYVAPTDTAPASQTYVTTVPPILESAGFQIQSLAGIIQNFEYMTNNEVALRPDANSVNALLGFVITNREPGGSCDPEATTVAAHDFWNKVMTGAEGTAQITIGTQSGNKTKLSFPRAQYNDAAYEDRNGILVFKTPLQFNAAVGESHCTIKLF
jgi:hypothetical protein